MDGRGLDLDGTARTGTARTARDQSEEVIWQSEVPFACNICFHTSKNPVATACGHLFCWLCLYSWLGGQARPCPVCRTMVMQGINIIPIYTSDGSMCSEASAAPEPNSSGNAEGEAAAPETLALIPQRPRPPSPRRMGSIPVRIPLPSTAVVEADLEPLEESRLSEDSTQDNQPNQNLASVIQNHIGLLQDQYQYGLREFLDPLGPDHLQTRTQEHRQERDRIRRQHAGEIHRIWRRQHLIMLDRNMLRNRRNQE